jgi:DNA-binding Lrp family transcriptional regulator
MSKAIIFACINDFNVGDVSEMKLTDRQLKILGLVKEFPSISGRRMSEILSVSQRTAERDLAKLKKMGILKHEGEDKNPAARKTPHYPFHTPYSLLPTPYSLLPTPYSILHTPYSILHTTYYILHTPYCILHTTYYILHTTYYILHTTHYTLFHNLFVAFEKVHDIFYIPCRLCSLEIGH